MVKALVCVITRKTDKLRAKVQRQLSVSTRGGKFQDPCASIFGLSRKIHGMNRQRALHRIKLLFTQAQIFTFGSRKKLFQTDHELQNNIIGIPAGTNIIHNGYRVEFETLPLNQDLHENKS